MKENKRVKRKLDHQFNIEISELKSLIPLVVESNKLLKELEADSLVDLEIKLNKRSGFVNASMSAMAYGLEVQYNRLLAIEKKLEGRLSSDDLNASNELKQSLVKKIEEANTIYYTDRELEAVTALKDIIKQFNSLDANVRRHMGFNRNGELMINPLSPLIR